MIKTSFKKLTGLFFILLFSASAFVASSCKDDDAAEPRSEHSHVNDWILKEMEFWYLWESEIPSKVDKTLAPDEFFKSILSSKDRFSWIQANYQELLNALKGVTKEAGYEFVLYRESPGSNNVIAQILYVKPQSPAANAGLQRGDVITKINGTQITVDNYRTLLDALKENHSVHFKALNVEDETFSAEQTIALTAVEYAENPNYLHKVITVDDKKVGYFVYNLFVSGPNSSSSTYDTEMETIFANFKSQGITSLVLDLRFNSGGSEVAAKNLASLIGKSVNESKVFFNRQYNDILTAEIMKDPDADDYFKSYFATKPANIGNQLEAGTVYILTSSRTASASELIINGLKPYMNVYLIGDVTYGKSVGSISLYDKDDPTNTWGMQPIIMKTSNALSESNYDDGFTPNMLNPDNSLYLYPLGDSRETLLSNAIAHITGEATGGRLRIPERREIIGHSLDVNPRSYNLFIESDIPGR